LQSSPGFAFNQVQLALLLAPLLCSSMNLLARFRVFWQIHSALFSHILWMLMLVTLSLVVPSMSVLNFSNLMVSSLYAMLCLQLASSSGFCQASGAGSQVHQLLEAHLLDLTLGSFKFVVVLYLSPELPQTEGNNSHGHQGITSPHPWQ
jgi:hypothetical protein